MANIIDPMPTHVPVGLRCAVADAAGEAIPAVINALIQLTESLVEVSLDVVPAR